MERKTARHLESHEEEEQGNILHLLKAACEEFFPSIKKAGSLRCAICVHRILIGMAMRKLHP